MSDQNEDTLGDELDRIKARTVDPFEYGYKELITFGFQFTIFYLLWNPGTAAVIFIEYFKVPPNAAVFLTENLLPATTALILGRFFTIFLCGHVPMAVRFLVYPVTLGLVFLFTVCAI